MSHKALIAFLILILLVLSACGDKKEDNAAVQGSNPQRQPTAVPSTVDTNSTPPTPSPTASPDLPVSIINPGNAANLTQQFETGEATLYSFSWSPDNLTLIANTSRGLRFYDLFDPESPPQTFEEYRDFAVISPDSTTAISRNRDGHTVVWDIFSGDPLFVLEADELLSDPQFSPDGQAIAAIEANTIRLWDATNGSRLESIELQVDQIDSLFYRDDGAFLALGNDGTTTVVRDVLTDEIICEIGEFVLSPFAEVNISENGHIAAIPKPAANADNPNFIAYNNVEVWNTLSCERVRRIRSGSFPGLSSDGASYASFAFRQGIVIRELESDRDITSFPIPQAQTDIFAGLTDISLSPDNTFVAGRDYSGNLYVIEVGTGTLLEFSDFGSYVTSLDINPAGDTALIGMANGDIWFWDITTGDILREGNLAMSSNVYFLPDHTQILNVGGDVSIWDADSFERTQFVMESNSATSALSPDATMLAVVEYDYQRLQNDQPTRELRLWNLQLDGPQFDNIPLPETQFSTQVIFSPNSRYLVLTSDNTHVIYDTLTRAVLNTVTLDDVEYSTVDFHPDSETLILVALASETVGTEMVCHSALWSWGVNADAPQMLAEFDSTSISELAYSPDGSLLALGGQIEDGAVILWDTTTHEIIATLDTGGQGARYLRFTADGAALIFVGNDNFVRVWGLAE